MSSHTLPYGTGRIAFELPDAWHVDRLEPTPPTPLADVEHTLAASLSQPLGGFGWHTARRRRRAVIVINDKTRWAPNELLLPPLMAHLHAVGFDDDDITFVIATGLHNQMPATEFELVVPPEILARCAVYAHNPDDSDQLQHVGYTGRGTPVYCNRRLLAADLRIVVGVMEPHQFMGFSGGVKSAVIGLGGRETVRRNHTLMREDAARIGRYQHNPVRDEVEEIGQMLRIDLALNVVADDQHNIVAVLAGEPVAVMQAGIPSVRACHRVVARDDYDMVITSPGGHPKDCGLYQAQKALTPAVMVARTGAPIVLVAACPDGSGDTRYEEWVTACTSQAEVIERFGAEGFRIGPHKAFQFAQAAAGRQLLLLSNMDARRVRSFLLSPVRTIAEAAALAAVALAIESHPRHQPRVAVLPFANSTLPVVVPQ